MNMFWGNKNSTHQLRTVISQKVEISNILINLKDLLTYLKINIIMNDNLHTLEFHLFLFYLKT